MRKLRRDAVIFYVLAAIFFLVLILIFGGCNEVARQDELTTEQMKRIAVWSAQVSKQLKANTNNINFLRSIVPDPNEYKLLNQRVQTLSEQCAMIEVYYDEKWNRIEKE